MHPPNNNSNPAEAGVSSMHPTDHHQIWSPQPPYNNFSSSGQQQQQQSYLSPTHHGSYYNNQNNYSFYSTPPEQSGPPSSPPRISQNEGSNLSMMSSIEETSSIIMDQSTNHKKMILATPSSNNTAETITAEHRQEVVNDRAQNDFMSRVASPTREQHLPPKLPPKKRKAMSKETMLLMEIDKLKADLGKAQSKIMVLEEENGMLRHHRDTRPYYDMANTCSFAMSHLPFIPDLPGNTASPGKDAFDQHHQQHQHLHRIMNQQKLQSIYRVPSSKPDNERLAPPPVHQNLQIPQDVFIQSHHRDIARPVPYHPYSTTTTMNTDKKYERQHSYDSTIHGSSSSSRDWIRPPNNNHIGSSSSSPESPKRKISFALSFDANAKSGSSSMEASRGYNRCVSNRGRGGSRPPLASRWKSR
jgi:hypothetical protein